MSEQTAATSVTKDSAQRWRAMLLVIMALMFAGMGPVHVEHGAENMAP